MSKKIVVRKGVDTLAKVIGVYPYGSADTQTGTPFVSYHFSVQGESHASSLAMNTEESAEGVVKNPRADLKVGTVCKLVGYKSVQKASDPRYWNLVQADLLDTALIIPIAQQHPDGSTELLPEVEVVHGAPVNTATVTGTAAPAARAKRALATMME